MYRVIGDVVLEPEVIEEIDGHLLLEEHLVKILDEAPPVEEIGPEHKLNDRPVIGIFTQPYNDTNDYLMASYWKFVESAGARAVPIVWRDSDEDILNLIPKLNGVLFPGGSTELRNEDGSLSEHSEKVALVLNKVKELNDQGIYYPIISICMGFQQIAQIEAPYHDTVELDSFDSDNHANNVTLNHSILDSVMFSEMPKHLIIALQFDNITYNHHIDGIFPSVWNKYYNLREGYHLLGNSYDDQGVEYVAFVESKEYPIWGLQFHPEKNIFSWRTDMNVPHSQVSIEFSQFLANFFVTQAKKNFNRFKSDKEAFKHMIQHIPIDLPEKGKQDVYIFDIEEE